MGGGAEILILPLGAMALLSVVAVFAAFFNRTAARRCAVMALGLAILFLLIVLQMNRWNLRWLLFVAREVSYPFVILGSTLFLSAVAVWAPLRRADSVDSDGGRVPGEPRRWLLTLAGCLAAVGTGYGIAQLIEGRRGEEKTQALLAGDPSIRLRRVQIEYQQRRIICTDPEVLRYLEGRFRSHESEPKYLGTTYQLSLSYDGGGTQSFVSYWAGTGDFNLFLGEPGEGGRGHGIRLARPRPQGVEELVGFLIKPHREVAGEILILEAAGSRIERDESLVAR